MRLYRLDDEACLAAAGNRTQLLVDGRLIPPVSTQGNVLSACAVGSGRVAIGTAEGVEVWERSGNLVKRAAVAGGVSALTPHEGAALGVSPKDGFYRVEAGGRCDYFPTPLRTKFDGVWVERADRVWAGYTGGLLRVEGSQMTRFHEPLGLAGFRVFGAAPLPRGGMVFLCSLPGDPWVQSSAVAPFVLAFDGKRWRRYTYADGLPGEPSAVTTVGGQTFLSCTAGVYRFIP